MIQRKHKYGREFGVGLWLLVWTGLALVLTWPYLFGGKALAFADIGSDTWFQFYPLQTAVARQLRDLGSLTWSFDLGLGGYLGAAFDPFWCLQAILPDDLQLASRIVVYLMKGLLGGLFFLAYLRTVGFRPALAAFGALAYAWSGYFTLNGQWDPHGTEVVQYAAFLFFLERFLRNEHPWDGILVGLVAGIAQSFALYDIALLGTAYIVGRCIVIGVPRGGLLFAGTLLRLGTFAALGVLLTAPWQLPGLYYLFENPRVAGAHSALSSILASFTHVNDRATISAEVLGLLGKDMLGAGDAYKGWANYFEGPGFYVGLPSLFFAWQLLSPRSSRSERRLIVLGLGAIGLFIVFPAFRFAVYGFGHVAFRLSCLWISMLLIFLGVAGLRRLEVSEVWWPGIALGVAATAGLALAGQLLLGPLVNREQVLKVLVFASAYVVLIVMSRSAALRDRLVMAAFALLAVELAVFSSGVYWRRNMVDRQTAEHAGYRDGTEQALAWISGRHEQSDFFRVERDYDSVFLCDALVQGYHGVKSYFFNLSSITRYVDSLQLPRPVNSVSYIGSPTARPAALDFLGVRYLLSRAPNLVEPGLTHIGAEDGVHVYERENAAFVRFQDSILTEAEVLALPPEARDQALLTHAIVADADRQRVERGVHPAGETAVSNRADLRFLRDDRFEGEIESGHDQLLSVAIPFDRGWAATLDGNRLDLVRTNFGFIGALIPQGVHKLALAYTPVGRRAGNVCAVASLAICLLVAWISRTARSQHPSVRND